MSLHERPKTRHSPDPYPGGVSRSRSFAGILSHRRTASASATFTTTTDGSNIVSGCSNVNNSNLSRGATLGGVLGQSYSPNTSRHFMQGLSATWSVKPPKTPRPVRTQAIFEAISKGLRECNSLAQDDISNLRSTLDNISVHSSQSQGRLYELEKQIKTTERYMKRLEYQLSKLEELKEQYDVQQKMRDGVRTMAFAYELSPGRDRGSALHNVRSGYKECTDILCAIEAELERMMGTLHFQMKGIQGFARLCAGDVFEITVKHSDQKWKSRGRILKNKQSWDNLSITFKALLGEPLLIKAVEVRGLGKNMLLGNKYCETKDLFSAHQQLMTVNLNPSGSLKLNLIITWNPLHGCPEESSPKLVVPPLLAALGSPLNHRRCPPPPISEDSQLHENTVEDKLSHPHWFKVSPDAEYGCVLSSGSSSTSTSAPSSAIASPDVEIMAVTCPDYSVQSSDGDTTQRVSSIPLSLSAVAHSSHSKEIESTSLCQVETCAQRWSSIHSGESSECCSMDLGSSSQVSHIESNNIQDVVHNLTSSLEDIQGQYPDLFALQQHVLELEKLLRKTMQRRSSTGSNISISVESALGCFDFLNTAIDSDEVDGPDDRRFDEEEKKFDPEMTAKTSDSGISSIARQLLNDGFSTPSLGPSPQPPTTGSEQLDLVLLSHLVYCQRLLEHLGSYGPLKCQEIFSLDKLRRQTSAVGTIVKLVNTSVEDRKTLNGSILLEENIEIQKLWEQLAGDPLCVTAEHFAPQLEKLLSSKISKEPALIAKVSRSLICEILDVVKYEPELIITALQFNLYFTKRNCSPDSLLKEFSEEVILSEALQSKDSRTIKEALDILGKSLPTSEPFLCIGNLLLENDSILKKQAESFLQDIAKCPSKRKQVLAVYLEGLESENPLTRQSCCAALAVLEASEYIEQLAYISYADENDKVCHQAKDTLFKFGDEGSRVYEQLQLFTHGFQGLTVK